nr:unnamed protein product [Callosobruchus analis]
MQRRLEEEGFANRLVFSNEATFHLRGKVIGITSAFGALKIFMPSWNIENRNRHSVRRYVVEWLMPQLEEKVPDFVFQQDGAPPYWHNSVREYLNEHLPRR